MKCFISKHKALVIIFIVILFIFLIAAIDSYGGVSQNDYDSSISEKERLSSALVDKDNEISELNKTIDSLNKEINELNEKYKSYTEISPTEPTVTNSDQESTPTVSSEPSTPIVTYEDIETTEYNDTYVYIDCVIDNFEKDSYGIISFDTWYPYKDTYKLDSRNMVFDDDSIYGAISNLSTGDSIRMQTKINEDSSFGINGAITIKPIDSLSSIKKIKKTFKKNCKKEKYSSLLRNPDSYFGSNLSFTGKVFQIVEQTDDFIELLLDTGNEQYVHINYYFHDGDSRILENDSITVYGYFYKLFSYTTLLGDNKEVPELSAVYLELN